MSDIRPLHAADIPAVSRLFQATLRRGAPSASTLEDYFRTLFLDGAFADPATPSLVSTDGDDINGFIGITAQPLIKDSRPLKAAIASSLMVRDHDRNPLLGVRLLKTFLSGAQDLSLTETASGPSLTIWRQLGGQMLEEHSLDWVRVLSPVRLATLLAARRLKAARLFTPLAGALDGRLVRRAEPGRHAQWGGMAADFRPAKPVVVEEAALEAVGGLVQSFADDFQVRPVWSPAAMTQMLADLPLKPQFGAARIAAVKTPGGAALGLFVYYLTTDGHARVLQLLARRGHEGLVVDSLLADAVARRACVVEGRITPRFMQALMARRCLFMHRSASAIHTRDAELVEDFTSGRALFNGLIGEYWSRLWGGEFDDKPAAGESAAGESATSR